MNSHICVQGHGHESERCPGPGPAGTFLYISHQTYIMWLQGAKTVESLSPWFLSSETCKFSRDAYLSENKYGLIERKFI